MVILKTLPTLPY